MPMKREEEEIEKRGEEGKWGNGNECAVTQSVGKAELRDGKKNRTSS